MKSRKRRKIIVFVMSAIVLVLGVKLFLGGKGDYVDRIVKEYNPQGASVILLHNGKIAEIKNYGDANIKTGKKVTEHTIFKIASISKSVTSYAVMQLVDQGILNLDEPVNHYLKSWKIPEGNYDPDGVTLRTLMSHTSGITGSDELGYTEPLPSIAEALKQRNIRLKRTPGEKFEYSEFAGLGICQMVIEDVMGMKFEDYMQQNVFAPLHMSDTGYENSGDQFATPYAGWGKEVKVTQIVMNGGGGVSTSSHDLAVLVEAMIEYANSGNKEMFQAQKNTKSIAGEYGLGIIPRKLSKGKMVYEHNGTLTGWNAQMAFEPESGEGLVVVSNSDKAYYMTYELMEQWGKEELGEPVIDGEMQKIHHFMWEVITAFGIVLCAAAGMFCYRYRKSRFVHKKNYGWIGRTIVAVGVAGLYVLCIYTQLPFEVIYHMKDYYIFTFFPREYGWINVELLLFLGFWILRSQYKKGNRNKQH